MPATGREQKPGQRADDGAVCPGRTRTGDLPTQDTHLMGQHRNLRGLGCFRAREEPDPGAELAQDQVHKSQTSRTPIMPHKTADASSQDSAVAEYPAPTSCTGWLRMGKEPATG
jgi:hypothetical protein